MKFLIDQNLPRRLLTVIGSDFPESIHVRDLGLAQADDGVIWGLAKLGGYAIMTKDRDFPDLVALRGIPPQVVWLRCGNISNRELLDVVRRHRAQLLDFAAAPVMRTLVIG